ncbi:malonate--CoA ligase [Oceanibacterium hippocampi]|uniref:Long-chain-fatty-acid--CoA ligase n=1 Tax=Oceanibacterium hippocampi TaxID=745714 RepID=A0A1Y5TZG2_9PROT|nr:malonyl-CoA synthase [Oceanibacterium hippocampi]SLN76670.1 Long-chain-fatty-acid--CoA ligase [Oceanibacterium hippocampi]
MANVLFDALLRPHLDSEAVFLHLPDGSRTSYRAFLASVGRYANALRAAGLQAGDRLAMQVEKSPEALSLYGACMASGIVFLPLNTAYTTHEIGYFVGDATPGLVVCDPAAEAELSAVAAANGANLLTLDGNGGGSLPGLAAEQPEDFEAVSRGPDDLAVLLYTSGTTGRSKGAMLTHDNLLSNARALTGLWRITAADTLLHALPIFHAHGLFVAINTSLLAGAAMIFLPRFEIGAVLDALPGATTMMGVPTYYTRLLDEPRFTRETAGHMRLFVSGSAPLLAETHQRFEQRTGHRILERYGMTETGMNSSNPYDAERRAGTVGFPLPGIEIRIADQENGAELAAGEIGRIEVRGPNVFKGYWQMPDKTAEEFREDGFFITGDLGLRDADGYIQIVGRGKDLIISGGFNVYPKEVELVLDEQEAVRESAVIGVPHPDFGEGVVGVLVPESGATPDVARIAEALGRQLARYKQPKRLIVVDELPRNTMGKVQKNILRETYRDLFAGTAGA